MKHSLKLNFGVLLIIVLNVLNNAANAQCVSQSAPTPQMGAMVNVPQYVNLWKLADGQDKHGRWFGANNALSIGDDGWPIDISPRDNQKQTHTIRFGKGQILPALNQNDVLKVRFKGPASAIGGAGTATWQNIQANNPTAGYTTAELRLGNVEANGFWLNFIGRVTEIQIIRPGYDFDDPRLVVDEYVTHTKHWKAIRFMGLMGVNSNLDQTWPKRLSKNAPIWLNKYQFTGSVNGTFSENINYSDGVGWQRGTSWEDQIDLCNYLNLDMWINVPLMADDNYIKNLAILLKERLKPSLNVNVEVGNELWNTAGGFLSFSLLVHTMGKEANGTIGYGNQAEKMKIYGGNRCVGCELTADEGNTITPNGFNHYTAMQRWQARRLKEYAEQFGEVFGWKADGGGVGNRIRMILAGMIAYAANGMAWNIGPGIEFLKAAYGPDAVNKYLYAVAITSYTTPHGLPLSAPASQIIESESHNIDEAFAEYSNESHPYGMMGNKMDGVLGKARMFGLKMYAYEGGNEIAGENWRPYDNSAAYYADPRSGQNTTKNLTNWFSWFGYDALFIKNGDYQDDPIGGYGISKTLNELSPIRKAYLDIANAPAPPLSTVRGNVIGAQAGSTLDARKVAGYWSNWETGLFGNPAVGYQTFANNDYSFKSNNNYERPFIIRCQKNGRYKVSLERVAVKGLKAEDDKFPTYADIYINEKLVLPGVNLSLQGTSTRTVNGGRVMFWTTEFEIDIPYGVHSFRVQPTLPTVARKGNDMAYGNPFKNTIELMAYKFTLAVALPPFQPKPVIGDLVVCKGNNKASYQVGENDVSVCEYEWTGLPAGAKILAPVAIANTNPVKYSSGPGAFRAFIDWGNTAPGNYTLSVVGKNQDAAGAWQSSVARTFIVKVEACGFDIAPNPVCIGQPSLFTPVPMSNITQYVWDNGKFGTPNAERYTTNTANTPLSVTYATEGVYNVSLKTIDATGKELFYFNTVNAIACNAPTVVTPVSYCKGAPAVAVTATATNGGTNLKWYTSATGNTAPTTLIPSTAEVDTISYWVSQMNATGESDRARLDVIVSNVPAIPTISDPNTLFYCKGGASTLAELSNKVSGPAAGASIKWYTSNTSTSATTPTAANTAVVGTTSWYVSQAIGECESPRVELKVQVEEGPQFTVEATAPLTCGQNGKLTLKGLTAGTTYTVSYNTPPITADSTANSNGEIVLNLPQGIYNNFKVAKDGCSATVSTPYTLTEPESPTYNVAAIQPLECGAQGALNFTALKPNTTYQVSYNSVVARAYATQADGTIRINLPKGTYNNIKVSLGNCTSSNNTTYTIIEKELIAPVEQTGPTTYCQNQVVNITDLTSRVKSSPGNTLRWYTTQGATPTLQPQPVNTSTPGNKTVYVSQANSAGCESPTLELTVVVNPSSALTVTPENPSACEVADGKLIVSGLPTFVRNYSIEYMIGGQSQQSRTDFSNPEGILIINNLGPGIYSSITVTPEFGSGCLTNSTVETTLSEPTAPTIAPTIAPVREYCENEDLLPLRATATGDGTIEWYADASASGPLLGSGSEYTPNKVLGTQTFYALENRAGCKSPAGSVSITIVPKPVEQELLGAGGPASCNGIGGYPLTLRRSEIGVSYQYYEGGAPVGNPQPGTGSSITLATLSTMGSYTVKAMASVNGCEAPVTDTLTITEQINPAQFTVSGGATGCEGVTSGANILLSGSELNVTYTLNPGNKQINGDGNGLTFVMEAIDDNNGTYTVSATNNQNGCPQEMLESALIDIQSGVRTPTILGNLQYCNNGTDQIEVTEDNATDRVWSISPGEAGTIDNTGKVIWNHTYTGAATIKVVVSNTECGTETKESSLVTTLTTTPQVSPIVGDSLVCSGNVVTYNVIPQAGITYNWSINANTTAEKDDSKGTITITFLEDLGKEGAILSVTPNSVSCGLGQAQSKQINKDNGCDLFVPNILTPSTADKNSVWQLEGVENFPNLSIQIFNRWGAVVHSQTGRYDKPWDGTKGGIPLPTATYYYVIDKNDGTSKITGSVTVMK